MAEHPTACPAWQEDLAAWLTAQITPEREAALTAHLETCAACRGEADSLLTVAAVALTFDPDARSEAEAAPPPGPLATRGVAPDLPAELGPRIERAIAAERGRRRALRAGVAALAAAAVVAVVVLAWSGDDDPAPLVGEQVAFTVVPPGASADAVIADDGDGSIVEIRATGLDPDVTYALWLSPPGGRWDDRVAGGTFRPDADGTVVERLRCALPVDEYGRVWVTTPEGEIALDTE
jgi:hypothetical protein